MEKWKLFALLSMFFAGLTAVVAKLGMNKLSADVALFIRTAMVLFIVTVNAFWFNDVLADIKQSPRSSLMFLALSSLTTAISWVFYYRAMKEGPVAYVSSIDKGSIVVTIILSFYFLKEPITIKMLVGTTFIVIGLVLLVLK
ncbi:MAG: EamA family transporter [Chitinophagales bacterium]|jgi:transporter family protein|nr:EamA family transporter [Chitinophagales bacterium]HNI45778.1 EamA family transporter [Chitinophagales bacterium]